MAIQVMGENSDSVSKFLPLFTFGRHNFKHDNNQTNIYIYIYIYMYIYMSFANIQIDNFLLYC